MYPEDRSYRLHSGRPGEVRGPFFVADDDVFEVVRNHLRHKGHAFGYQRLFSSREGVDEILVAGPGSCCGAGFHNCPIDSDPKVDQIP